MKKGMSIYEANGWAEPAEADDETLIAQVSDMAATVRLINKAKAETVAELDSRWQGRPHVDPDGFAWKVAYRRVRKIIDRDRFVDFVGSDWPLAVPLSAKISGLRTIARMRGLDEDTVEDTLLHSEWKRGNTLNVTAPK